MTWLILACKYFIAWQQLIWGTKIEEKKLQYTRRSPLTIDVANRVLHYPHDLMFGQGIQSCLLFFSGFLTLAYLICPVQVVKRSAWVINCPRLPYPVCSANCKSYLYIDQFLKTYPCMLFPVVKYRLSWYRGYATIQTDDATISVKKTQAKIERLKPRQK